MDNARTAYHSTIRPFRLISVTAMEDAAGEPLWFCIAEPVQIDQMATEPVSWTYARLGTSPTLGVGDIEYIDCAEPLERDEW